MRVITFKNKSYEVDTHGFLGDGEKWDEDFARVSANAAGIHEGLTDEHWKIINYIREAFYQSGSCPVIYETCRANGVFLRDLKRLFPAGYLRGACKLAGITYQDRFINYFGEDARGTHQRRHAAGPDEQEKVYRVNVDGFLVEADEWDEEFAHNRAIELLRAELTEKHMKVIKFMRDSFKKTGEVPNIYETCEKNQMELNDLERLFPTGYHRGAVKIAGLRVK